MHKFSLAITLFITLLLSFGSELEAQYGSVGGRGRGAAVENLAAIEAARRKQEEQLLLKTKAPEVLRYMNTSVDPCVDFYEYACGGWAQLNEAKSAGGRLITVQNELELLINKELQNLLAKPQAMQQVGNKERKMRNFYNSCLSVQSGSTRQQNFLVNFVRAHGGMPQLAGTNWQIDYNWSKILGLLRANYGLEILIGLDIDINLQTNRGMSIYLSEPKTTLLSPELCNEQAMQTLDMPHEAFQQLQQQISANVQSWFALREDEANIFAGDIVRFEFDLCTQMRRAEQVDKQPQQEDGHNNEQDEYEQQNEIDRRMKFRGRVNRRGRASVVATRLGQQRLRGKNNSPFELQSLQYFNQRFKGNIDFKQFVENSFMNFINQPVYMRDEHYFEHLARLVRKTATKTLANYIMYRAISVITFPLHDNHRTRPRFCVEQLLRYFPKIMGEMYQQRFYRPEYKLDAESIFAAVRSAFSESLQAEWLDENVRRAARQKLSQFKTNFPDYQNDNDADDDADNNAAFERLDYWRKLEEIMKYNSKQQLERLDSPISDTDFNSIESHEVRAKLLVNQNEILTGLGLFRQPYYHQYYPNSLKYSHIGQVIARELISAFDEQNWLSNALSQMRLDPSITEQFKNRTERFRTQISNYLHNSPDVYRNSTQVREFIADCSGLNIAFNAYLNWLQNVEPSNRGVLFGETLPEVNFSNTQLFFLNFAQTRCFAKGITEPPPDFLPLDKHTMERFYVNGPLFNSEEFSREFGCARGSDMNPDDKCVIY